MLALMFQVAKRHRAVVSCPALRALTFAGRDTSPVVVASSDDLIYALSVQPVPSALVTHSQVAEGNVRTIGDVCVHDSLAESLEVDVVFLQRAF